MPLRKGELMSLRDHLRENFEDPRRSNRAYPASSLLALLAIGLLAGRKDLAAIQRYGCFLTPQQRKWLGFPMAKDSTRRKCPSYRALWWFVQKIDPEAFAACFNGWLSAHVGTLPRALALDGKWVRDRALRLCLSEHESGAPVAVGFARAGDGTQQAKREGEQTVAKGLYKQPNLHKAVITADALFCDQHQVSVILEAGADYVFQIKNENRTAWKAADATAAKASPFYPHGDPKQHPRTPRSSPIRVLCHRTGRDRYAWGALADRCRAHPLRRSR